jgi:hypothetical protein
MDFISFHRTDRQFGFRELVGILNRVILLPYPIYGVERLVYAASREAQPSTYLRRLRRPASRALRFFSSVLLSYLRRRLISCSTPARITSRRNLRKMDSSPSFSSTRICTLYPLAATTAVGARRATCATDGGELFPENGASGSCSSVLSRELVAGAAMAAGLLRVRGSRFCVLG